MDALNDTLEKVSHGWGRSRDTPSQFSPSWSRYMGEWADDQNIFPTQMFDVPVKESAFSSRNTVILMGKADAPEFLASI